VAHESRRRVEPQLAGLEFAQLDFAKPGLEGFVANLLAQSVANAHPVCLQILAACDLFHTGPRHRLLFVRCVLGVAQHRRLNSVHDCLHGSPAAFHPPTLPRFASASRGPSKPSATLKQLLKPAAVMAFAAAAERTPLRQRNRRGAVLSGKAADSSATNCGLGCMLGKTCHSISATCLARPSRS